MKTRGGFLKKLFIILCICFSTFISCSSASSNTPLENTMEVHYINVGQGDSILVRVNNKNMLIDSGPKDSRQNLLNYLNSLDINTIDYLIATHPHEDHIGNMNAIIKKYTVNNFFSPKVSTSSKTFELMIESLKNKDMKINILNTNTNSLDLGENTKITVLSPLEDENFDNLNNYSAMIKIEYGETSFLFTGDCEKLIENNVLSRSKNLLKSHVLKLGHHGSSTSSSEEFLCAVNPSLAIITSGKDNSFGHPHLETLNLLKKHDINFFNTAYDNTIILISDGNKIIKKSD